MCTKLPSVPAKSKAVHRAFERWRQACQGWHGHTYVKGALAEPAPLSHGCQRGNSGPTSALKETLHQKPSTARAWSGALSCREVRIPYRHRL
jgi:hypothetical protein